MDSAGLFTTPSSSLSFTHLLETEEDFPFGAKTTSFLPPATPVTHATAPAVPATTAAMYDLPEWMEEGGEILGLPDMFEDLPLLPASTPQGNNLLKLEDEEEEDYSATIKPEDMLVPLSELQPPSTPATPPPAATPPASPPHVPAPAPASAHPPLPKIIICRKVTSSSKTKPIQVHFQVMPEKQVPQILAGTPLLLHTAAAAAVPPHMTTTTMPAENILEGQGAAAPLGGNHVEVKINDGALAVPENAPDAQVPQTCDAEELINEMVQMISSSSSSGDDGLQEVDGLPLDASMMGASLEDLLLQLDAPDSGNTHLDSQPPSYSSYVSTTVLPPQSSMSVVSPSKEEHLKESKSPSMFVPSLSPQPSKSSYLSVPSLSPQPTEVFSVSVPTLSPQPSESPPPASISIPVSSVSPLPASPASISLSLPSESPFSTSVHSPASPDFLPSPVPSVGSLSPTQSGSESLFCGEASSPDMESQEEEWSPLEETHSYSRSQRKAKSHRKSSGARKTPYHVEDRKERKKEQNKQAALRYRQKKKQEEDELMGKIEVEEERQQKLKSKYSGLKQELSYLKKIMREVFIARGLLSEEALKKAALEKKSSSK